MRKLTLRQPMTPEELWLARALWRCRFAPATWDKRFARSMGEEAEQPEPGITSRQREHLYRMAHRYRKQLGFTITPPAETSGKLDL